MSLIIFTYHNYNTSHAIYKQRYADCINTTSDVSKLSQIQLRITVLKYHYYNHAITYTNNTVE